MLQNGPEKTTLSDLAEAAEGNHQGNEQDKIVKGMFEVPEVSGERAVGPRGPFWP